MQKNGCDCGVSLLKYYEHLVRGLLAARPTVHVTKASVENDFSNTSFEHWFNGSGIPNLRQKIRGLVDELAREHKELIESDKTRRPPCQKRTKIGAKAKEVKDPEAEERQEM